MNDILKLSFYHKLYPHTLPWVGGGTALSLLVGLYLAFWGSPLDYQHKETVRIMYLHVPASWLALGIYASMGACALAGLVWKNTFGMLVIRAVAPLGLGFTVISLTTGAIWGKPMWGTWWVWDARLTSMLVLAFLYGGYLFLIHALPEGEKGLRLGSFLVLLGLINLPIIKFSVDWWATLHQPASFLRKGGPSVPLSMLKPLVCLTIGFIGLVYVLMMIRIETLLLHYKFTRLVLLNARRKRYITSGSYDQ